MKATFIREESLLGPTSIAQVATHLEMHAAYTLYNVFWRQIGLQLLKSSFSPLLLYASTVVLLFQLLAIFSAFLHRFSIHTSNSALGVQWYPVLVGQPVWSWC